MSRRITYQAARDVAATIEKHFEHHLSLARQREVQDLASVPQEWVVEAIIDTAFWASIGREEGISPRISLALLSPEQAKRPILFLEPISFTSANLTKLAPGVERPGIHMGIWYRGEELYIWGITHEIPNLCFTLDVSQPGLLVIKHRRLDSIGKFANVAVLQGDEVKIVDSNRAALPDCPDLLATLLDFNLSPGKGSINILVQLAVSMRAHGRGGALLVVPAGSHQWRDSIVHPFSYAVEPVFTGLSELEQKEESGKSQSNWLGALRKEVDVLAGFTAIDGATLINDRYELLAFGVKIKRMQGKESIQQMLFTEPVLGNNPVLVRPSKHGGTRHLSAAQFVHDQHNALALVASQDGRFTVFSWSPCDQLVHAHRVDSLLM